MKVSQLRVLPNQFRTLQLLAINMKLAGKIIDTTQLSLFLNYNNHDQYYVLLIS